MYYIYGHVRAIPTYRIYRLCDNLMVMSFPVKEGMWYGYPIMVGMVTLSGGRQPNHANQPTHSSKTVSGYRKQGISS